MFLKINCIWCKKYNVDLIACISHVIKSNIIDVTISLIVESNNAARLA